MQHMNERKPDQKNNIDLLEQLQDVDLPEQKNLIISNMWVLIPFGVV